MKQAQHTLATPARRALATMTVLTSICLAACGGGGGASAEARWPHPPTPRVPWHQAVLATRTIHPPAARPPPEAPHSQVTAREAPDL